MSNQYLTPNYKLHAALAFAYFQAESSINDERSDDICCELFDIWGNAWAELGLELDVPSQEDHA